MTDRFIDSIKTAAGVPLTFGNTANDGPGKVYFVNPTNGSNDNTGLKMEKPFKTIAKAYTAVATDNHDVIVLSASSGLAETDELAVTKNRVHFHGLDAVGRYYGQRSRWTMGVTTGTAIAIVQNTGVGNTFSNIKFDSADTLSTSKYAFADGGEYTVLEHCEIYSSGQVSVATAAQLLMNGDSSYVKHCYIGSMATAMTAANTNVLLTRETIAGKVCRDVTFEDCIFALKSTSGTASHLHATTATDVERFLLLKNCIMMVAKLSTATVGDAIIVDSAQTEGQILLLNTFNANSTEIATTGSVGVLFAGPATATAGAQGNFVAVSDS
ncbi:MAG: hypothetical protein NUV80_06415 [Candidatus Berkelbacteria bacterium]|nr:hypothetical protein [Candidatus Berkelbacteria bacterium]